MFSSVCVILSTEKWERLVCLSPGPVNGEGYGMTYPGPVWWGGVGGEEGHGSGYPNQVTLRPLPSLSLPSLSKFRSCLEGKGMDGEAILAK